ncbi:sodium-translocating pyrophosphatase [Marinobacteraceae bacterium S3BR75-40.1]
MITWLVPLVALGGLAAAGLLYRQVTRFPAGPENAQAIARHIRTGAKVYLRRQYSLMLATMFLIAVALWFYMGLAAAGAFVAGALCSGTAGLIGMLTATLANVRTATAAQTKGRHAALHVAFTGGSVMGMAVASLGLLGLSVLFLLLSMQDDFSVSRLTAFGLGASSVALFARVGGGIFTKSADVGADLVGKIEAGIAEDDPRNPGVIADNVGDNVGDVAGMGADLFESYCSVIIAAIAIALALPDSEAAGFGGREALLVLPLALTATGLVASLIAIVAVGWLRDGSPERALAIGMLLATLLYLGFAGLGIVAFDLSPILWLTLLGGTLAGIAVGAITEFYTKGPPTRHLAAASETGAATVVIRGLALGMESLALPLLVIAGILYGTTQLAGLYGVALAAVGMLSTAGIVMAIDAYGPIADNAGGIAQMAGMGEETRAITDDLDQVGNTTAAIGKGYATGAAALAALALMSAFVETVSEVRPGFSLQLTDSAVLFGLFVGGMLPFVFSAQTMRAVGSAADEMIREIRRQFDTIPGLREGNAEPDSDRCTAIATQAALLRMFLPGGMALLTPILIGLLVGPQALGGLLAGALVTGVILALFMANAGGAWDNAKKYIEAGHHGGKGSPAHNASIVGDTIGDPFKDTAGPSMNILIKVLAIVSLLLAPFLG